MRPQASRRSDLEEDLSQLVGEGVAEHAVGGEAESVDAHDPSEQWYILLARNISRIGFKLQTLLQGRDLMTHYCEWCSVPDPRTKGVSYVDAAFLYMT